MKLLDEIVKRIPLVPGWWFYTDYAHNDPLHVRIVAHCDDPKKAFCVPCGKIEQDHQCQMWLADLPQLKECIVKDYLDAHVTTALHSLKYHIEHEGMEFPWNGQLRGA